MNPRGLSLLRCLGQRERALPHGTDERGQVVVPARELVARLLDLLREFVEPLLLRAECLRGGGRADRHRGAG